MSEVATYSVRTSERETSNVFVSHDSGSEEKGIDPFLSVLVTEFKDGERHLKPKGGKATFTISRTPGLVAALAAAWVEAGNDIADITTALENLPEPRRPKTRDEG